MTPGGVHVRVQVGAETYALAIESVLEVAELDGLTPVPGAGTAVLGVTNFHGQVLPVFDLARVLGGQRGAAPSRLVVADRAGRLAGLAVDAVTDVSAFDAELQHADSAFLTHAGLEEGRLVGVVDLESLFAELARQAG